MRVSAAWKDRLDAAQKIADYTFEGQRYARVPYGSEGLGWGEADCNGCGAKRGQFHVPDCEYEKCPRCGETPAAGHSCAFDEIEETETERQEAIWRRETPILGSLEEWLKRLLMFGVMAGLAWLFYALLV